MHDASRRGWARSAWVFPLAALALVALAGPAVAQSFHASLHEGTMPGPTPDGEAVAPWPSLDLDQLPPEPGEPADTVAVPRGMRAPESGYRLDDETQIPHLRFDGVDDVLVFEPGTTAQRHSTISMSVRTTQVGAYQALATFVLPGVGGAEPRRLIELGLDEEGRPTFSLDSPDGGGRLTLSDPVTDGEWHEISAGYSHYASDPSVPGGTIDANLMVDTTANFVQETWDATSEPAFVDAPGSYHVGGVAADDLVLHPFAGDIASVFIDHYGFAEGSASEASVNEPEPSDDLTPPFADVELKATSSSTTDAVGFVVALEGGSGASIVAVDETGAEHDLGAGAVEVAWLAPRAGLYRFEAREYAADGSYVVVASDTALAMPAPHPPGDIVVAALAASAIVGVSAALAARGVDLLDILRGIALNRAQGRFYAATKEARIEKRVRLGSISAALVAIVLMSLILSAGRRLENVVHGAFLAVFIVAGIASIAFSLAMTGAQAALARAEQATPRYRLWVAGAISLAFSTLAFGIPFGFAGSLSRDPAPGAPPETPRHKAFAAIVGICLVVAAAPLFLAIGAFTRFAFAEVAIAIALGGVFVSALPIRPLPGQVVWGWSKGASLALLAGTFVLQSAYHLGALGAWGIVAIGVVALLAAAALTIMRVRRGREGEPRRGIPT